MGLGLKKQPFWEVEAKLHVCGRLGPNDPLPEEDDDEAEASLGKGRSGSPNRFGPSTVAWMIRLEAWTLLRWMFRILGLKRVEIP